MAEGGPEFVSEYTKTLKALETVEMASLFQFFKEQSLKDETLLSLLSREELNELFIKKLAPFTNLWFEQYHGNRANIARPRLFGEEVGDFSYEKEFKLSAIEDREVEFKSFRIEPPHVGPQHSWLIWTMMNKAKKFICGCLNADRKGIIYFGVDDQREILGLDIEDKQDEIVSAFQDVLTDHIKSDSGKLNQGEQDCVKRHFIPVKSEGNRTRLYVMEIEVARDWKFCKDNVYYSKTWREKKDKKNNDPNLKALKDYFTSKPGEWDDAPVRNDGRTSSYPKEEVHEMVKIPLQKKLEEWQSSQNQDSNKLPQDRKDEVVTEADISNIGTEVGTCWKSLATQLGIKSEKCEILDQDYTSSHEKAIQLLLNWIRREGSKATVGRLADALVKIEKTSYAEKLFNGP